ncbi:unnamed protein product [Orchesella dallaii]|uniref:IQ motif and ubiquitin-like domain-containing protein n=1 Tax=Orchesella dallaii TaxID=48710 RepID=A0ABP1RIB1_9HEXA
MSESDPPREEEMEDRDDEEPQLEVEDTGTGPGGSVEVEQDDDDDDDAYNTQENEQDQDQELPFGGGSQTSSVTYEDFDEFPTTTSSHEQEARVIGANISRGHMYSPSEEVEYGGEDYIFDEDSEWRVEEEADFGADATDDEEEGEQTKPVKIVFSETTKIELYDDEEEEGDGIVEEITPVPAASKEGKDEVKKVSSKKKVPKVKSVVRFDKVIDEFPARQKLDELAKDLTRRRDPNLKYFSEPGETCPTWNPGELLPTDDAWTSETFSRMDKCPSIESFFRLKKFIDVHFYLYPGGRMISRDCRLDATVYQLKNAIAHFVQVPADHLDLRRKKNLVADSRTLMDLGAGPMTKMKFTVEINKRIPGNYQLKLPRDKETMEYRETNRHVTYFGPNGEKKLIPVTIVYPTEPKAKLGGYQDSRTLNKYFHASTSTANIDADIWEQSDSHKAVQVFHEKVTGTQTRMDIGQQMERADYYISSKKDRILYPKPYVTFAQHEKKKKAAIITIQRYWRGWLARKERKQRMEGLIKRIKWAEKIRKGRIDQRYAIMEDEIRRQENPSRMVDIELLYRAINLWRKEQEEYVVRNRWGAERKAALAILTEMEADLLLDLERTRKRIKEEGRGTLIEKQFSKMGKPKRWLGAKTDTFITLDTKERLNVRQLHHTYKDLKTPVIPDSEEALKERFELLGRVNEMIKGITSRLGVMLSDLITRELTYIRTNCPERLMKGLRKRIANCFFLLCQDPLFNPEAKRIQKVPFDYGKLRKDMVQCKGCRRMQYRDEFTIQRGTTVTTRCHTCMGLYRTAILRVDLNLYRHMLDELRKDELAAGVSNSVTFLIDAFDLQFLVEQIWHGQSALSGIDNRYLLRLCRWIKGQPFSPWNCVLLTEEEAVSHLQLDNMKDAYRESFFHKVFVMQCTAKSYFEGLAKLAVGLDDRILEGCDRFWAHEKQMKLMKEKFKRKARLLKFFAIKM